MSLSLHAGPAVVSALIAAAFAVPMPRLVARLPEPAEPAADKIPYAELGSRPRLALHYALWAGVAAGVMGAIVGWHGALLLLVPLSALGVALGHIDFRTRLLPKLLVGPAYPVALVALVAAAAVERDLAVVTGGLLGGLIAWAAFWLLWRLTPGMGYGDVRLSGLIGLALGVLGWQTLGFGLYAGFLLGAVGWVPLRLLGVTRDRHFAFGPFMLLGGVVGICVAAWL